MTSTSASAEPVPQPNLGYEADGSTEVLLIRHGRSADVVPGTPESKDPSLHVEGVAQAEALARRLAGKQIDAIYASHLQRAVQTAEFLAAPRGLSIVQIEDLQEVLLGEWGEGEFRRRAAIRDPEFLAFLESGRWDSVPGGEGDAALRRRVHAAVHDIVANHPGQCVAVVAHGGAINAFVAELFGVDRSMLFTIENTSVTTVRIGGLRPMVMGVNDHTHLRDPLAG